MAITVEIPEKLALLKGNALRLLFLKNPFWKRSWFWQKLFTLIQDPKLIGEAYLIAILELFFLRYGTLHGPRWRPWNEKKQLYPQKKSTYRPKNSQIILKHLQISSKTRTSISDVFCVVISLSRSLHCQFTGSILQSTVFGPFLNMIG